MRILSNFDEDEHCAGILRVMAVITYDDQDAFRVQEHRGIVPETLTNYLKTMKKLNFFNGEQCYMTTILFKDPTETPFISHGPKNIDEFVYDFFDVVKVYPTSPNKRVLLEIHLHVGDKQMLNQIVTTITKKFSDTRLKERRDKFFELYKGDGFYKFNNVLL